MKSFDFFRSVERKQKEKEVEDERLKAEKEKREERERERQERPVERAARDRSVLIIVYSSEWSQCMLKSVNKFPNALLVSN